MPDPPALIETLRYEDGYRRLERHLARMAASAKVLGHAWRRDEVERALAAAAEDRTGAWRVRVELQGDGRVSWRAQPLGAPPPEPVAVALAEETVEADDPWRRHKTTRRALYDAATEAAAARGLADVLFLNDRGGLVEGAVSNVFVARGDRVLTPPLGAGALPGVLRAELLERGWAVEEEVDADLLRAAERLWIGSSLRGLRSARLRERALSVSSKRAS